MRAGVFLGPFLALGFRELRTPEVRFPRRTRSGHTLYARELLGLQQKRWFWDTSKITVAIAARVER